MYPFDYTAFAVSEKVGVELIILTTPVGWLSLFEPTILSWSSITVLFKFYWLRYCVVILLFKFCSVYIGAFVI